MKIEEILEISPKNLTIIPDGNNPYQYIVSDKSLIKIEVNLPSNKNLTILIKGDVPIVKAINTIKSMLSIDPQVNLDVYLKDGRLLSQLSDEQYLQIQSEFLIIKENLFLENIATKEQIKLVYSPLLTIKLLKQEIIRKNGFYKFDQIQLYYKEKLLQDNEIALIKYGIKEWSLIEFYN